MKITRKLITALLACSIAGAFAMAGSKSHYDKGTALSAKFAEGLDVQTKDGTELGTLDDMIVNLKTASIDYFIVDTGVLGIGGEEKIIPASHIKFPKDQSGHFTFKNEEAAFHGAPALDDSMSLAGNLKSSFGVKSEKQDYVRANAMNNQEVYTSDRAHVGEVEAWVISPNRNTAPYFIVRDPRFGISTGNAYEYYLVDGESIRTVDDETLTVHLDLNIDEFGDAPDVDDVDIVDTIERRNTVVFRYELASM